MHFLHASLPINVPSSMAEANLFACVIEIYSDLWLGGLETDFVQPKLYWTVQWGSVLGVNCGSIGRPITSVCCWLSARNNCYLPIAMLWWLISMKSSGLDNWKTRQSCFLLIIICQTGTVTIAFHLCAICQLHMCCHLQRHDYKSNINQVCLNKDKSRNLSCTANAMGAAPKWVNETNF